MRGCWSVASQAMAESMAHRRPCRHAESRMPGATSIATARKGFSDWRQARHFSSFQSRLQCLPASCGRRLEFIIFRQAVFPLILRRRHPVFLPKMPLHGVECLPALQALHNVAVYYLDLSSGHAGQLRSKRYECFHDLCRRQARIGRRVGMRQRCSESIELPHPALCGLLHVISFAIAILNEMSRETLN